MSASLPPAPSDGARRGPGDPASTGVRDLLWLVVGIALLLSVVAVAVDVRVWRAGEGDATVPRLLAATAMVLLGVGVVGGGAVDRAMRDVPRRLVPWMLVALGGLVLGVGQGLGYAFVAGQEAAFPAWVEDGPTIVAGMLLGAGAVLVAWPPGMRRQESLYGIVDTAVAALALLVIWQLYVLPLARNDDSQSGLSDVLVHLDAWWQWGALVMVVLIAATSRRSGSLSFVQLLLTQASLAVFVLSDLAGDVVPAADASASVTPSLIGYAAAGAVFVAGITRRGVEPDPPNAAVMRERWAIALPGAVLVLGLVALMIFRVTQGTLPWNTVVTTMVLFSLTTVAAVMSRLRAERDFRSIGQLRTSVPLERAIQEGWLTRLVGDAQDVVCLVDARGRVVYTTPSLRAVFGLDTDVLVGAEVSALFEDLTADQLCAILLRAAHDDRDRGPHELALIDPRGARHDAEVVVSPLTSGDADYFVLTVRDVTDRRLLRAELTALQDRDALTGLANRSAFMARVDETVAAARPGTVAVLLLDLDDFSDLNDSRGQAVGDLVLAEVGLALDRLPRQVGLGGARGR